MATIGFLSEEPRRNKSRAELDAEIEQMAREQGVKPFDFDEVFGMGKDSWSDEEFAEFEKWLHESRRQEKEETGEWLS